MSSVLYSWVHHTGGDLSAERLTNFILRTNTGKESTIYILMQLHDFVTNKNTLDYEELHFQFRHQFIICYIEALTSPFSSLRNKNYAYSLNVNLIKMRVGGRD